MEENIEKKQELKSRFINFFDKNKFKFFILTSLIFIAIFALSLFQINVKKNNSLIAEKYIQAGIYIALNKKDEAKVLYEEIILSKNKFYSILSFNSILEKKLITDKKKILNYFKTLEEIISNEDQKDLIIFKKALYLIKTSDLEGGKKQLDKLRKKNSKLKSISDELISK